MKTILRRIAASGLGVGLTAAAIVLTAPEAAATVYNCVAPIDTNLNEVRGWCDSGFGGFRVGATCYSPHYPYSIDIYSPYVSRSSASGRVYTGWLEGDHYNCHIGKAWIDASS
ncbi:hypothetical protein [Actinokineospora enzanensis]|uniref:hypothetical protein n=1 Tax=Actinokineospora enzanensis TaxID=155975 RepID=UPI0003717714|nr:hypothetical protein [Actinokineospora enzanensis]